jgi:hypothetical protein
VLTPEHMKKIIAGVVAGRIKPTGLPMNRAKLDALARTPTRPQYETRKK